MLEAEDSFEETLFEDVAALLDTLLAEETEFEDAKAGSLYPFAVSSVLVVGNETMSLELFMLF